CAHVTAGVNRDIIAVDADPIDLGYSLKLYHTSDTDWNARAGLRVIADISEYAIEGRRILLTARVAHAVYRASYRLVKARRRHRFDQIVHRMHFECLNGVFAVRRHKDHRGAMRSRGASEHAKPI